MVDIASGTFSDTGQSATVVGSKIVVRMAFAGTANVDVEVQMPSGAWIVHANDVAASLSAIYDFGFPTALRLNCTAHTNDVEYLAAAAHE